MLFILFITLPLIYMSIDVILIVEAVNWIKI